LGRALLVVPVGTTACRTPFAVVVLDRRHQPRPDQAQDVSVDNPTRHASQQLRVRDAVEVAAQIGVYHLRVAGVQRNSPTKAVVDGTYSV
jgi:hypothetical protein